MVHRQRSRSMSTMTRRRERVECSTPWCVIAHSNSLRAIYSGAPPASDRSPASRSPRVRRCNHLRWGLQQHTLSGKCRGAPTRNRLACLLECLLGCLLACLLACRLACLPAGRDPHRTARPPCLRSRRRAYHRGLHRVEQHFDSRPARHATWIATRRSHPLCASRRGCEATPCR